jgi:hypothetical protein
MDCAQLGESASLFKRQDQIAASTDRFDQATPLY